MIYDHPPHLVQSFLDTGIAHYKDLEGRIFHTLKGKDASVSCTGFDHACRAPALLRLLQPPLIISSSL